MITWLWMLLAALVGLAGLRYRSRLRGVRPSPRAPVVDDAALRAILEEGRLRTDEEDEPLDLDAAARAEDEFWNESWDEPDEFRP